MSTEAEFKEPTISRDVAIRLIKQLSDAGLCEMQAENGSFLVKNGGVSDDGAFLSIVVFARIL